MSAHATAADEPQPPDPATFDLTRERVAEFEKAYSWFGTRLMAAVCVVTLSWSASEFFSRGGPAKIDFGTVFVLFFVGFMGLAGSFAIALVVSFPGAMIVEAVWKRMQSDYPRLLQYERAKAQHAAEHATWLTTQRSWWDRLHPQRFEREVAEHFKKQGHRVEWTGRSGDGGVDIRLTTRDNMKIIVQCKSHEKPISPGAVRDLYGTLLHEKADEGWLMSRSGFTGGATTFASGKAIRLLSLDHILPGLGSLPGPRRASRRRWRV